MKRYGLYCLLIFSLFSFSVHAQTNLAINKKTTASSSETTKLVPAFATDGSQTTRWSSAFSNNQWLAIDLGGLHPIDTVKLTWQTSYAAKYKIQVSNDGVEWADVYSQIFGDGGIDTISLNIITAHVRIYCITRATQYGFSLLEVEIYKLNPDVVDPNPKPSKPTIVTADGMIKSYTIGWNRPTQRENGTPILPVEIGGYEIIGRNASDVGVYRKEVHDKEALEYSDTIPLELGVKKLFLAVYDVNGLYSRFVEVAPKVPDIAPPPAPNNLRLRDKISTSSKSSKP